jgi:hypothetical protein
MYALEAWWQIHGMSVWIGLGTVVLMLVARGLVRSVP